jgi:hypothetical protein
LSCELVAWNCCSANRVPPAVFIQLVLVSPFTFVHIVENYDIPRKKLIPQTSNKLLKILPIKLL